MEKIKNIEMLRFLFSLSIVCVHFKNMLKDFSNQIPFYKDFIEGLTFGYIPVWFFFIIAGFFFFWKTDFNQDFITFAKKKLIRFMPVILFTLLLCFVASLFTSYPFLKYENIFTLLCLQNTGLTFHNGNVGVSWFVSSLFWTMAFYFYLYKCVNRKMFNLITACIVFFCNAMIVHLPSISAVKNTYYVINSGMLIGFANVGLGYFMAMIYTNNIDKIKNLTLKWWQTLLCTAAEIYLFCFLFYYMCFHKLHYNNILIFILAFVGLFGLFVVKKGWLSKLLENNFSVFFGQFAFSIYITHYLVKDLWTILVCKPHGQWVLAHPYANILIPFSIMILLGVTAFYLVEKPAAKYLKKLSL